MAEVGYIRLRPGEGADRAYGTVVRQLHRTALLARAFRHERAGLRDLRSDRIGILRERDGRGVMRSRLLGIARLFRSRSGAERGSEPVRLLFQGRLVGGESFLGHATL